MCGNLVNVTASLSVSWIRLHICLAICIIFHKSYQWHSDAYLVILQEKEFGGKHHWKIYMWLISVLISYSLYHQRFAEKIFDIIGSQKVWLYLASWYCNFRPPQLISRLDSIWGSVHLYIQDVPERIVPTTSACVLRNHCQDGGNVPLLHMWPNTTKDTSCLLLRKLRLSFPMIPNS